MADSDSPWPTLYIDSWGGLETAGGGSKRQKTVFENFDLYFLGFPAIFEVPGWQKRILQVQEYRFHPWNHGNSIIFHEIQ